MEAVHTEGWFQGDYMSYEPSGSNMFNLSKQAAGQIN